MMNFGKWLDTFIEEKELPIKNFAIEHKGFTHFIDSKKVISLIKQAPSQEQEQIKSIIVKIDFKNGDVNHFLEHLAKGYIVNNY
ncbi:MAG: hypothetical protein N4A54_04115 [Peptostreptococcaceae bacterium]|nr:hypothetical protein [Peptostreptococcaceae bacterium]